METILIVDDNKDLRWNLSNILNDQGYETLGVEDGKQAIKAVKKNPPDCVLLDIKLPGMDGITVLEKIMALDHDITVLMLTAYGDIKDAVRSMKLGAFDYLIKPFDTDEIILIIKKALHTRYLSSEVDRLREKLEDRTAFDQVMGDSPEIRHVLNMVNIVAPTNMTVILQGESGTGKEIIANMIHNRSARKEKPFIAVDCGAIPETLIESELFGYEKGAFTGAHSRKEGKIEQADNGTILMDEVGNLTRAAQMKLLRVVQERRFQRIGGHRDIKIDVRILAALNTSLSDAVKAGNFREDLFHRLNEFQIDLPSLRERKDDIPVLSKHFLEQANTEFGKEITSFSAESMNSILNYQWPGNVREFKNFIKRAVLMTNTDTITLKPLAEHAGNVSNKFGIQQELRDHESLQKMTDKATRQVEKSAIEQALELARGNKTKAAAMLKIDRMTLYSKIKKLGLG